MLNNSPMYVVWLEDYSLPRYNASPKPYMGSREDIEELMKMLSEIPEADVRYADLIEKVVGKDWESVDIMHTVSGQNTKLLNRVREICRGENLLDEPAWEYASAGGNVIPMAADNVEVEQVLIEWRDGQLCRFAKVYFDELMIRVPHIGWCALEDRAAGFPAMYSKAGSQYIPQLYSIQQVYAADQRVQAIADTVDCCKVNLSVACRDILGEL